MKKVLFVVFLLGFASCAQYSSSIAKQMSFYSDITHCSDTQIISWQCDQLTSEVFAQNPSPFDNPERKTAGFMAFNPSLNAIVIAFRGSENIQNWITNLDFIRTDYDQCYGCSVHKGFLKAYRDISSTVELMYINFKAQFPDARLIVTGHSLGGALAILCAIRFKESAVDVDLVYTFGQPRVGNKAFADYYTASLPNTFRLINYADTVVHSPPKAFGFLHHGNEVWYSPRGMYSFYLCASEDKNCANSVSTLKFSTDDHHLVYYEAVRVIDSSSTAKNIMEYINQMVEKLVRFFFLQITSDEEIERLEVEKLGEALNKTIPFPEHEEQKV